jgi:hypothetical protein
MALEIGKEYQLGKYLGKGQMLLIEQGKVYRSRYLLFENGGHKARVPYRNGIEETIRKLET